GAQALRGMGGEGEEDRQDRDPARRPARAEGDSHQDGDDRGLSAEWTRRPPRAHAAPLSGFRCRSTEPAPHGRTKEVPMHTVIRNYKGQPTLGEELTRHRKEVESLISGIQGFIAYYLVKTTDGIASVTVCEDKKGCDESSRRAADWLRQNL